MSIFIKGLDRVINKVERAFEPKIDLAKKQQLEVLHEQFEKHFGKGRIFGSDGCAYAFSKGRVIRFILLEREFKTMSVYDAIDALKHRAENGDVFRIYFSKDKKIESSILSDKKFVVIDVLNEVERFIRGNESGITSMINCSRSGRRSIWKTLEKQESFKYSTQHALASMLNYISFSTPSNSIIRNLKADSQDVAMKSAKKIRELKVKASFPKTDTNIYETDEKSGGIRQLFEHQKPSDDFHHHYRLASPQFIGICPVTNLESDDSSSDHSTCSSSNKSSSSDTESADLYNADFDHDMSLTSENELDVWGDVEFDEESQSSSSLSSENINNPFDVKGEDLNSDGEIELTFAPYLERE